MEKLKDKNGVEIKVSDDVVLHGVVVSLEAGGQVRLKLAGDDRVMHYFKPDILEVQPRMEKGMPEGMAKAMGDATAEGFKAAVYNSEE